MASIVLVLGAVQVQLPAKLAAAEPAASSRAPFVASLERFDYDETDAETAGRVLISELSCTACHRSSDPLLKAKSGPDLADAGLRVNRGWTERFLLDPAAVKPGTAMPEMLGRLAEPERRAAAAALTAYLESLQRPFAEIKGSGAHPVPHRFWALGDGDRGRSLYHRIGCVACHEPDPSYRTAEITASPTDQLLELLDPEELAELGLAAAARPAPKQPIVALTSRHTLRSLTLFLLNPQATRPGGRMPDFQLSATDAADVAAFLFDHFGDEASGNHSNAEADASLVRQGKKLFGELNCVACHTTGDVAVDSTAVATAAWNRLGDMHCGCVAETDDAEHRGPRFRLDSRAKSALSAARQASSPAADSWLTTVMMQMNCYACHERDGLGGVDRDARAYFETVGNEDLGDEGRLPPPLSLIGLKSPPARIAQVLQGRDAIRPHMHARMPRYPANLAKELSQKFVEADRAHEDAVTAIVSQRTWPEADQRQTEAGRTMMDAGCVQCHLFRGEALPGVSGVDLAGIDRRVNRDWFHAFLLDPAGLKTRTRMPTFFPDGKSQNHELLDGDTDRQIAAVWGYLKTLNRGPLPQKIEDVRAQDFELVPTDRPILLRTFMRGAGTSAIAVGYPQQVHASFDAATLRFATGWKGRFLDAQGTWFIRSAPPADPLGSDEIELSRGPILAFDDSAGEAKRRFLGYRLDADGVPTFEYIIGGIRIEDRMVPEANGDLRRRLTFLRSAAGEAEPAIRLLSGWTLTPSDDGAGMINDSGLTVLLSPPQAEKAIVRSNEAGRTWVLPWAAITGREHDGETVNESIELEFIYRW